MDQAAYDGVKDGWHTGRANAFGITKQAAWTDALSKLLEGGMTGIGNTIAGGVGFVKDAATKIAWPLAMVAPPALGVAAGNLMSSATSPSNTDRELLQKEMLTMEEEEMLAEFTRRREMELRNEEERKKRNPNTRTMRI